MFFFILRHGQTDYNKKGIYQGRTDVLLNKIGEMQAEEALNKLKQMLNCKEIDEIIVSPLKRTMQTAKPIADFSGKTPVICEGITERDFGNLEGNKPNPNLTNQMMLDYEKNYSMENIEPIQDVFKRGFLAMDNIIKKYSKIEKECGHELNIVIVTHASMTYVIECYFNGMTKKINYDTLEPLVLKNAEIRKYRYIHKG